MIKTWIAACGLAVCLMAQPVMAGPLEDVDAAVRRGDYATALDLYRPLAEQRNAETQPMLGTTYYSGWCVPKYDAGMALDLYRPLAEQRNAEAQLMLGTMYYNGWCVPKDNAATALDLYRPLVEQRNAEAQAYARYHVLQWLGSAVGRCRKWLEAHPKQ